MSEVSMLILVCITDLLQDSDIKNVLKTTSEKITKLLLIPTERDKAEANLLELQSLAMQLLMNQNPDKNHKEIHGMIIDHYSTFFTSGIIPRAKSLVIN